MSDNEIKIKASVKDDASPEIKQLGEKIEEVGKAGGKTADELNKTGKATENLGKKTRTFTSMFDRASRSCTTFSVALGNLILQAGRTAAAFVSSLGNKFTESLKGFAENEMAANRLSSALKNQGVYSAYVAKELDRYAKSLREISGINDDTIKDNMRLLVNYGLMGDELKRATKAGLTLSSALGMDLNSSMLAIAKATEGNYQMFSRWGIKINETGSQSEKFSQLLGEIEKKYGDLVNVNANNMLTQVSLLKEQWSDLKEELVSAVAPAINSILNSLNNFFKAREAMKDNEDEAKRIERISTLYKLLESDEKMLAKIREEESGRDNSYLEKRISNTKEIIAKLENESKTRLEMTNVLKQQGEAETQLAQKRIAGEKAAEEAQKKREDEAKKELERQKELESKKADLLIASTQAVLEKVANLRKTYTSYEYAEKVNQYEQEYTSKLSFLDAEAKAVKEKYGEQAKQYQLLLAQKQQLEQEYSAFLEEEHKARTEIAGTFYRLDLWLSQENIKSKIAGIRNLAQVQTSNIQAVAAVGKAAAMATATIDTYKSANEAYAAMAGIPVVGPALAAVAAAAAIVAGLENVANIAGVQLAVGTGYVPQDMQATIHKGEIVVPKTFSDAIRAGDMALSAGDSITNNTNTTGGSSAIEININVAGDIIGDTSNNLAKSIQTRISKFIATGQTKPFPTREKM